MAASTPRQIKQSALAWLIFQLTGMKGNLSVHNYSNKNLPVHIKTNLLELRKELDRIEAEVRQAMKEIPK